MHCLERWILQLDTSNFSIWTWLHDVFIISHGGSGRRVSTNARQRDTEIINIRQGLLHVSFVSSPFKALLSTCLGAAEQLLDCTLIQVTNCVMSPDEARGSVALSYAKSGRGYNRGQNYRKITLMSESKEKPHSVADAGKHRKRNGTALLWPRGCEPELFGDVAAAVARFWTGPGVVEMTTQALLATI